MKSLSRLLRSKSFPVIKSNDEEDQLKSLQLKMLRIQQGVFHKSDRVIVVFEGFDASGKGGAIRKLIEVLDPRGLQVHPIGPPDPSEQAKHWLYRFWQKLPPPGTMAIFDRSWYGRVLVERVEGLTKEKDWKRAYTEINQFEKMLTEDGITIIKFFLGITKDEQLKRFEDRLKDPYKQWKITEADLEARKKWKSYVEAVDEMLNKTGPHSALWNLIPANDKAYARHKVLSLTTEKLKAWEKWIQKKATPMNKEKLKKVLKAL